MKQCEAFRLALGLAAILTAPERVEAVGAAHGQLVSLSDIRKVAAATRAGVWTPDGTLVRYDGSRDRLADLPDSANILYVVDRPSGGIVLLAETEPVSSKSSRRRQFLFWYDKDLKLVGRAPVDRGAGPKDEVLVDHLGVNGDDVAVIAGQFGGCGLPGEGGDPLCVPLEIRRSTRLIGCRSSGDAPGDHCLESFARGVKRSAEIQFTVLFDEVRPAFFASSLSGRLAWTGMMMGTFDAQPGLGKTVLKAAPKVARIYVASQNEAGQHFWATQIRGERPLESHGLVFDRDGGPWVVFSGLWGNNYTLESDSVTERLSYAKGNCVMISQMAAETGHGGALGYAYCAEEGFGINSMLTASQRGGVFAVLNYRGRLGASGTMAKPALDMRGKQTATYGSLLVAVGKPNYGRVLVGLPEGISLSFLQETLDGRLCMTLEVSNPPQRLFLGEGTAEVATPLTVVCVPLDDLRW